MDNKVAFIISTPDRKTGGEYAPISKIERENHDNDVYKNERFELAKNNAELKRFYKAISIEIERDDAIYIFGPGKSQEELKNVLKENRLFKDKKIMLGTSPKLSIPQMVARVRAHFEPEMVR